MILKLGSLSFHYKSNVIPSLSTGSSDLFSASSYAAAYYVYLWAEVLDAGMLSSRPNTSVTVLCIY
jgi:Zn-dependent oligopeptidase